MGKDTKVTSDHLKTALLSYLRFKRGYSLVATEVGMYSADVCALHLKKNQFIEVEVKISKSDLVADFKKPKHQQYLNTWKAYKAKRTFNVEKNYRTLWTPHIFYFLVTDDMEEYAKNAVEGLPYGVITYNKDLHVSNCIAIKKRGNLIHKTDVNGHLYEDFVRRMSSEICNAYQRLYI